MCALPTFSQRYRPSVKEHGAAPAAMATSPGAAALAGRGFPAAPLGTGHAAPPSPGMLPGALLYHPSGSTEPRALSRTGDVMSREVQFLINGSSKHKQYNLKALGLPFPASVDIPRLPTLLTGLQPRSQPVTRALLYRTPSPRLAEPSSPQVPEW